MKLQMWLGLMKTTKGGVDSNDTFSIFRFPSVFLYFSLYVCGCDLIIPTKAYAVAINFNLCFCYGLLFNIRLLLPTNVVTMKLNVKAKTLTITNFQ